MKRWKIWASIIALFVAGFLVGSAGTALYIKHAVDRIIEGGPPAVRRVVMNKLTRDLKLTEEQRARAKEVVKSTQDRLIEIRLQNEPVVDRILREGAEDLKGCLDEGQGKKLDSMLEKARSRWMLSERRKEEMTKPE